MDGKYLFRREDNGEVVEVPWDVMMGQDRGGFITLPDGVQARRCLHLEKPAPRKSGPTSYSGTKTIVSDALGFPEQQLGQFEEDRLKNHFTGIEFKRDPEVPQFFQVHCQSRAEFNSYVKHRGCVNKSGVGGVRLSQSDLESAARLVERSVEERIHAA